MPSDASGRDSSRDVNAPPSSGIGAPPSSGPAPSSSGGPPPAEFVAWGPVRDAITSIHNLETLLRSPRVAGRVLGEVLPEFLGGVAVLRGAFAASAAGALEDGTRAAREALAAFALSRLRELEAAMNMASATELDARLRLGLEQVVTRVSVDLDAAAELLDLSERAEHAATTELSLGELTRMAVRAPTRGRMEREIPVRIARREADECALRADPHVLKRLIAFTVARVHALSPTLAVTIRATAGPDEARLEIAPGSRSDTPASSSPMRLVRRIDPTDAVVDAAAASAGIVCEIKDGVVTIRVPRVV